MTSSTDGPLLAGPVRAYKDHKADCIIIETTKFHDAGAGLMICCLDMDKVAEARLIVGMCDLLKQAAPFAALGVQLKEADGEALLIRDKSAGLEITVGDVQRIAEACARAFPPPGQAMPRARRGPKRKFRPG